MDEYFCPNCGAILNEQMGFDPSCGTWTCTECGEHLMDDDVYEGDTFDGVAWYCDNCNALLNRQPGFSDSYGTWTCTECGHENGTTEDDIINNDEKMLSCPNCGDKLNEQWCFDEFADNWTCVSCGANLHHNYSDAPYTVVADGEDNEDDEDYENDDDENCEDSSVSDIPQHHSSSEITLSNLDIQSAQSKKIPDGILRKKRMKAFLFKRKKIEIGFDYDELLRKHIDEVRLAIHNNAFSNIKIVSVKDIYIDSPYQDGEVAQVIVNGSAFFESHDTFPYDAEIIITYHEKKEITIPFSAKSLRRQSHSEVVDRLQELGFTEIHEQPIKDLTTGWIIKDGSVENVAVEDNSAFRKGTTYKFDAKILIEYHTYKKSKLN